MCKLETALSDAMTLSFIFHEITTIHGYHVCGQTHIRGNAMKTYQQVLAVCIVTGLLGSMASYGMAGDQQSRPTQKQSAIDHAVVAVSGQPVQRVDAAASRFSRAAELFRLGQNYFQGEGVGQNDEEAAYYYKKSAELGNARAQISLGMMYANGRGVQKDFDEAIYWIRRASTLAQLSGHDAAVAQAVSWLQEASSHGYAPARQMLESIGSSAGHSGTDTEASISWFRMAAVSGDAVRHQANRPVLGMAGQERATMKTHGPA